MSVLGTEELKAGVYLLRILSRGGAKTFSVVNFHWGRLPLLYSRKRGVLYPYPDKTKGIIYVNLAASLREVHISNDF